MTTPEKPDRSGEPDAAAPPRPIRKCPICGKPAAAEHRPFCSKRCADIDLHRWLSGAYAIPASEDQPSDDEGGTEGKDD